jgi:hypothetical protein
VVEGLHQLIARTIPIFDTLLPSVALERMTISNMRANGVRTLAAWCLGRKCKYFWDLNVSG